MLQDIRSGRKTEIKALNVEICRRGEMLGIQTPLNQTLYPSFNIFIEIFVEVQASVFTPFVRILCDKNSNKNHISQFDDFTCRRLISI